MLKLLASWSAFTVLLLSGCAPIAPATAPPQLQHTPGRFYKITHTRFESDRFQLQYPANWRVVNASTADQEYLKVAFVAPDQSVVFVRETARPENSGGDETLILDEIAIVVDVQPVEGAASDFAAQAAQIIASIQRPKRD